MVKTFILLLLSLYVSKGYSSEEFTVVSYNMGQLRKLGFDFVPCTLERLPLQIEAVFKDKDSPLYVSESFILGLQEVWTKDTFKRLTFEALARNFTVFPSSFNEVQWNGLVVITNMNVLNSTNHYYIDSDYRYKSFIHTQLKSKNGMTVDFLNTHTDFSSWGLMNATHLSQLRQLSQYVKNLDRNNKTVLVGDFNIGPYTYIPKEKKKEKNKLWFEKIFPELKKMSLTHLQVPGYSWDMKHNRLAIVSTFVLNIYNFLLHATINWEEKSEKIDHIFSSPKLEVLNKKLVFDQYKKYECFGRTDRFGRAALSDHYGIMATFKLP